MSKLKACVLGAFAGAALALGATPASASGPYADSWRGFYVGIHGGYGWASNDFGEVVALAPIRTIGNIDSSGGVFGAQAGYNWQSGSMVGGLEIDFSATSLDGSGTPFIQNLGGGFTTSDTVSDRGRFLGSARARLGFAPGNFYFYGTGGLAWERVDREEKNVLTGPGIAQTVTTRDPRDWFGWVAGVGAETKLTSNWIARIEYLHYDFGTVEQTTTVTTNQPNQSFSDDGGSRTIDVVRAALSYRFN